MIISVHQRVTGSAFVLALIGAMLLWRRADQIYREGAQHSGWLVGVVGLALPPLTLGACALWLRWKRRHGETSAEVPWLNTVLVLSAALWVGMVLFSLM